MTRKKLRKYKCSKDGREVYAYDIHDLRKKAKISFRHASYWWTSEDYYDKLKA